MRKVIIVSKNDEKVKAKYEEVLKQGDVDVEVEVVRELKNKMYDEMWLEKNYDKESKLMAVELKMGGGSYIGEGVHARVHAQLVGEWIHVW